ncbi:hypothetical protein HDU96_004830 [Phlyctochytrium bullatum]|nr:hypothetical protein HDU96_004830 [Phlyctochytrium bullatum]
MHHSLISTLFLAAVILLVALLASPVVAEPIHYAYASPSPRKGAARAAAPAATKPTRGGSGGAKKAAKEQPKMNIRQAILDPRFQKFAAGPEMDFVLAMRNAPASTDKANACKNACNRWNGKEKINLSDNAKRDIANACRAGSYVAGPWETAEIEVLSLLDGDKLSAWRLAGYP